MKHLLFLVILVTLVAGCQQEVHQVYLDEMDISKMEIGWGENQANKSVEGNPLKIANKLYDRGVGTHAISKMMIALYGKGKTFSAMVGVDDESGEQATVEFFVLGDGNVLWQSGVMRKGDQAKPVEVNLEGVKKMALYISDGGDYIHYDHADWADAMIEYVGKEPAIIESVGQEAYILTPPAPTSPRINYPRVHGASAGKPFLFRVPVSGKRPIKFSTNGLPTGLKLDENTGIISGKTDKIGSYDVKITAENNDGKDEQNIQLSIGHKLALTPPMGWNSWNCWGLSVTQEQVKAAADAFVESGLADHGWTYINIDDGWEAEERTSDGELLPNEKFPDMKALADGIHASGLKLGIYSSPGPTTCGGYLGTWEHELQDAQTWAKWGIDYLKYDWCSYGRIARLEDITDEDLRLEELKKPYLFMQECLDNIDRDIIYSLCQYGMGDVWTWGADVGGKLWRTTGDITDSWASMAGIGFDQGKCSPYAKPGHWNDPDMLVVGQVGWGPNLHKTKLTPDEQYTHISLWSLLAAPLLLGCDLTQLDDFTLNLLTNDEVIAVNQDPLGSQASQVRGKNGVQVWKKEMLDGSLAVGIFYTGDSNPADAFAWDENAVARKISISWEELGVSGSHKVRDLWRQKDLGSFEGAFETEVNFHGVALLRLSKVE